MSGELLINLELIEKAGDINLEEFVIINCIINGIDCSGYVSSPEIYESLENKMYIKILSGGEIEFRQKSIDLLLKNNKSVSFEDFFNKYHEVTGLKKTDKEPARKHWSKMKVSERQEAINSIEEYWESLQNKKFCKKARTYLGDKNYQDEFEKPEESNFFTKRV